MMRRETPAVAKNSSSRSKEMEHSMSAACIMLPFCTVAFTCAKHKAWGQIQRGLAMLHIQAESVLWQYSVCPSDTGQGSKAQGHHCTDKHMPMSRWTNQPEQTLLSNILCMLQVSAPLQQARNPPRACCGGRSMTGLARRLRCDPLSASVRPVPMVGPHCAESHAVPAAIAALAAPAEHAAPAGLPAGRSRHSQGRGMPERRAANSPVDPAPKSLQLQSIILLYSGCHT